MSDTEFLDAFLGAFLGVWASSPGLWRGPTPLGPVFLIALAFLALYLQGLRVMVEAAPGSLARAAHPAALAVLGVQVGLVIALGAFSHEVAWSVNLGYGTIMLAWVGSVYTRPWLRRMAAALEATSAVAEAAAAHNADEGGLARE